LQQFEDIACFYCYEWRQKLLLHHIDLFYKLRYLYGTFDLKWFGQWCQTWSFAPRSGVFNAILGFWVFRQEIWCF